MMLDVCWLFVLIAYQLLVAVGHRVCGWKRKNERKTTFGVSPYSFIHSFESRDIREVIGHDGSFFRCFVLSQQRAKSPS